MSKILLTTEMLHAADDAWFDPLRRRPLHALWRRAGMLLDTLPKPLTDGAAGIDEGRAHIFARAQLAHQGERRFPGLPLDAKQFKFVDSESLAL
ncbi:hypothetical protein NKJ26_28040 [Mesorhizobium sp. M0152]|uniref:hypothetical protein n=1 Tax=Mesorhizobium sp. M0152 TaxID=2956898 RepID=UPI00333D922B